jgi:hypothetical protein
MQFHPQRQQQSLAHPVVRMCEALSMHVPVLCRLYSFDNIYLLCICEYTYIYICIYICACPNSHPRENVYPHDKSSAPKVAEKGKYCVRVFHQNDWRILSIDDRVPVDEDGVCLYPMSFNPLELWPLIIAKTINKLFPGTRNCDIACIHSQITIFSYPLCAHITLPTTHYPLLTTNYQLPTSHHFSRTPPTTHHLSHTQGVEFTDNGAGVLYSFCGFLPLVIPTSISAAGDGSTLAIADASSNEVCVCVCVCVCV